jgi:hypothetical protein
MRWTAAAARWRLRGREVQAQVLLGEHGRALGLMHEVARRADEQARLMINCVEVEHQLALAERARQVSR